MTNITVKYHEYFDKKRGCNAVKAITTYGGKYVSAVAYTSPGDIYDAEIGKKIAKLRLDIKIAKKRSASMQKRAYNYALGINAIQTEYKRLKKEYEKALTISSDRMVEADNYEKELVALLASLT